MKSRKVKLLVNSRIEIYGDLTEEQTDHLEQKINEAIGDDQYRHVSTAAAKDDHSFEFDFWGDNIEIEIDSTIPLDQNNQVVDSEKFKLIKLREVQKLVESGNGAIGKDGKIVDARENPDRPTVKRS